MTSSPLVGGGGGGGGIFSLLSGATGLNIQSLTSIVPILATTINTMYDNEGNILSQYSNSISYITTAITAAILKTNVNVKNLSNFINTIISNLQTINANIVGSSSGSSSGSGGSSSGSSGTTTY